MAAHIQSCAIVFFGNTGTAILSRPGIFFSSAMNEVSYRPRNLTLCISAMNLVFLLVGIFIYSNGNCLTMVPANTAAVITILLGVLAVGRTAFERRQKQEERDALEYHRQHGNTEMFGDADEAVRLASRTNLQYTKYFIPTATILMGLVLGLYVLRCWFKYRALTVNELAPNPLPMAILSFCVCIATLVSGSYFIGVSREEGCRWVRPAAAWQFLTGVLFLFGSLVFFCEHFHKLTNVVDQNMTKLGLVMLGVLAVELILSFVIEFYRPRMPNEEERPLPESRLLALFTEPGSVARNVAASLDYQFGFHVSDAWFYHFLERTIVPLFMVMVAALWLQTCIVVVQPSETALRQRFGKVLSQTPIGPGVYYKLPYPFESIYRFPSTKVQQLSLEAGDKQEVEVGKIGEDIREKRRRDPDHHGEEEQQIRDDEGESEAVILWKLDKEHPNESNFLVGAKTVERVSVDVQLGSGASQSQQGVGLFSAHIPVFFRIKDLYKYSYANKNADRILKNLAQRELLEYFIHTDWNDLLGRGRGDAMRVLKERVQKAADKYDLGIEVVFVALSGIHPPFGVGEAFDAVTAASIDRGTVVQNAQTYATQTRIASETQVKLISNDAQRYMDRVVPAAEAESGRFRGQLQCYQAAPKPYMLYSYYEVFEDTALKTRKYVVTGDNPDEVLWLNLERKAKSGLLDLDLGN